MDDIRIKFVEALPKRRPGPGRPSHWPETLAPMYDRPGQWALIRQCSSSEMAQRTALTLRRHRGLEGTWEFHSRDAEVYGRFVGYEQPASEA